jgi:4-carboxymuconolactone decarboxylase
LGVCEAYAFNGSWFRALNTTLRPPLSSIVDGRNQDMAATPTPAQQLIGDFAPKLVELTDDVLFADVWERPDLSKRDRSLITVAALVSLYRPEQLRPHLLRALDNGLTHDELVEAITHLAFYAGWPSAMSAITMAREIFEDQQD